MANKLPDVDTTGWLTVDEVASQLNLGKQHVRTLAKRWRSDWFELMGEFGDDQSQWPRQQRGIQCRKVELEGGFASVLVFEPTAVEAYTKPSTGRRFSADGRVFYKVRLNDAEVEQMKATFEEPVISSLRRASTAQAKKAKAEAEVAA